MIIITLLCIFFYLFIYNSTVTRLVGTFIGAVEGIVIWEISRGSVPGLIILTFVCYLPWWMIYINGKFWKATGLFTMITISLSKLLTMQFCA